MLGAILGDIIGSPYEFDCGDKSKDFPLFIDKCEYTDDSVMTAAVADALMAVQSDDSDDAIRAKLVERMQHWGKTYPNAGYGSRFYWWIKEKIRNPTIASETALLCAFLLLRGCMIIWTPCGEWHGSAQT